MRLSQYLMAPGALTKNPAAHNPASYCHLHYGLRRVFFAGLCFVHILQINVCLSRSLISTKNSRIYNNFLTLPARRQGNNIGGRGMEIRAAGQRLAVIFFNK